MQFMWQAPKERYVVLCILCMTAIICVDSIISVPPPSRARCVLCVTVYSELMDSRLVYTGLYDYCVLLSVPQ